MRVAIVGYGYGYGTGGQATALMLSADSHEVDVFDGGNGPRPVASNVQLTSIPPPWTRSLKQAGRDPVWNVRLGSGGVRANGVRVTR